jgi:hypothetical protein
MMRKQTAPTLPTCVIICLTVFALSEACGRFGTHSRKAVEQAIQEHLNQNTHLVASSFDTRIESVTFKGDAAQALVRFQSKQSATLFVEVRYDLRLENGQWQVVSSTPMSGQGGDSHTSSADSPPPSGGESHPR